MKLDPETPLSELEWVPRARHAALTRLGFQTLGALLRNYPRRYEDRRTFSRLPDDEMAEPVCLHVEVATTSLKRFGRGRGVFEAMVETPGGGAFSQPLLCRWFNMPYMQNAILVGQELVLYGRPKRKGRQIVVDHPEYELIEEGEENSVHMKRIVPVHPAGDGVTPRLLRGLIFRALEETDLEAVGLLAGSGRTPYALNAVHFPESFEAVEQARRDLALEECFLLQIVVQMRRARWGREKGIAKAHQKQHLVERMLAALPFTPTGAQARTIAEIRSELAADHRMHRLLQGDVGSGKTLVALAAMLHVIDAGLPAAIMAPTQILAEQHHANFTRLAAPLGVPVTLRTGSKKTSPAPLLEAGPALIVGTHSLLYDQPEGLPAGLVVIDEQHKFGVLQRARLVNLESVPDVLVMTATPIPRTLAQTVYGDLDVSVLDEKPAGRGAVRTVVRSATKLPEVADFLRKHLGDGRQAYIVYPLIEESEKLAAKAAAAEFQKWKDMLAPHSVGLLHGRTAAEEKDAIMSAFREGRCSALVSTTVIEVGVDVPNASLLLVENAERFGLAQLHQLRGRIGRGEHKSFCILLHDPAANGPAIDRLAVLEKTTNGFEVAEEDLRIRGPGNVLGTAQAGLPPLRLPDLAADPTIIAQATQLAAQTLEADPDLCSAPNARLRLAAEQTFGSAESATGG